MLFCHNYIKANILERLTSVDQLQEGSVIEVVMSGVLVVGLSFYLNVHVQHNLSEFSIIIVNPYTL